MDHFYESIPGWFDYIDLYRDVVARLPDGAHCVEVGVYQGASTAGLAVEIANSGKAIRIDCVDHFQGSVEHGDVGNLEALFRSNIAPVRHLIRDIHVRPSVEAATLYTDASLDFVWLDASHDAASVLADLEAWWPKVAPGGILAGHDRDWPTVQQALAPWSELRGVEPTAVSARAWAAEKPRPVREWSVPQGRRQCLVAVASNERTIYRQTVESLVKLGWGQRVTDAARAHGFRDVQFAWISRYARVDDMRNEAVSMANAVEASHLLFLDADMTWPADLLDRMLRHHDRGIVSGLYHLKGWPHSPVAFASGAVNLATGQVDYVYDDLAGTGTTLRPAALVGMGCALIPMVLCRAMPAPWFDYRQNAQGQWTITEDVAFCQRAAAYGCPMWIDPNVKCGHVGAEPVGEAHFHRATVERKALDDVARAKAQAVPA